MNEMPKNKINSNFHVRKKQFIKTQSQTVAGFSLSLHFFIN